MFKPVFSLILVIVAGIVSFFWSRVFYISIQELSQDRSDFKQVLDNTRSIQDTRDKLNTEYQRISPSNIDFIKMAIPEKIEPVKVIMELENIAQKSGVFIKSIKVGDADTGKAAARALGESQRAGLSYNFDEPETMSAGSEIIGATTRINKDTVNTGVSMSVSGSYDSFLNFLKRIEKSLRLTDIVKISFSSGEKDLYDFKVDINIYNKNYE